MREMYDCIFKAAQNILNKNYVLLRIHIKTPNF